MRHLCNRLFPDDERVTFYTTFGYLSGEEWIIPMRIWVHEYRTPVERLVVECARKLGVSDPKELGLFRSRIRPFVADSESLERVEFMFDGDPSGESFRIANLKGRCPRSDRNGRIEGHIRISRRRVDELLAVQGSHDGWLTIRAVSREHSGSGRIRLIGPEGHSVISDIDDTIKITGITEGRRQVILNTFFRDYRPVAEMAQLYRSWRNAAFHYVSGSPWQLFEPLSEFLLTTCPAFPEGSFHMKNARKNLLSRNTWRDLKNLVTNENLTYEQKTEQIAAILTCFPARRFTLVGDSGEKDPEVYHEIARRFPDQVEEILILDATGRIVSG